tara:strand:- start:1274 stop:2239 length:966 start_codon:yes stop_codon:yes gene_type:complete
MKINKILIILGEPQSVFPEILFKYFNSKNFKKNNKKIILIGNIFFLEKHMKKLRYNFDLNEITNIKDAKIKKINILNVKYNGKNFLSKISSRSKNYISNCFKLSFKLIKENKNIALINGPISKNNFLKKKYLGVTEYISKKTNSKDEVMLIYNKNLSVSPITTHLPLKYVAKNITKIKIINNVTKINKFYLDLINKKPKFAILGLNPHCETIDKISEENKIITPAINFLKRKKIIIDGPFPADTFFLKKNIVKYDVTIGMYHDQVLTPIKTLYNFNAINITLGLPFIRISPDHGPNIKMIGKNISDPASIFYALNFINNIK